MFYWPHAPLHRFGSETTFFITAGTYLKQHFYRTPEALDELQALLFAKAAEYSCWLQAWSLLSNHYHLVIDGGRVREMLARFHTEAAKALNSRDDKRGRRVWFQYWDKTLTFEASWLARLRYTHENPVHHGLVRTAKEYPWCSASWFERTARPSFVKTVQRMKIDSVKVYDPFDTKAVALPPQS
jgi:putative transposase